MAELCNDECGLACASFGHSYPQAVRYYAVATAAQLGCHAGSKHVFGHHGQLVLDRLEFANRAPKLNAIVSVLQGTLKHSV